MSAILFYSHLVTEAVTYTDPIEKIKRRSLLRGLFDRIDTMAGDGPASFGVRRAR